VAPPPPDHPHHKGLQFGLCASDVNFWEGDKAHEPSNRRLTIDRQQTTKLERLPPAEGNGFSQVATFQEIQKISVTNGSGRMSGDGRRR
jgi:hypothetical protein